MGGNFSQFMFKHSIPATAASFAIGSASATMAKTMASDMVIPLLYILVNVFYTVPKAPSFKMLPFGNSLIEWLCVLVTSYVLMEYVFARGMIGVSTVVLDSNDKKTMTKAREEAAKPIEQAKKVVREAVDGFTGGQTFAQYVSSTASSPPGGADSVGHTVALESKSKTSATLQTAPADFDGSI
jgi:large-conductance mechanosensitive channel